MLTRFDAMRACVVLIVCGLSSGFATPATRLGLLGVSTGRQGLASAGIGIGSMATNMATGLASQTLGALSGIPILGPLAKVGQAAVDTGNNFAQMGMGIGQLAVNGFGGLKAGQLADRQLSSQLAAQQQLAVQQQLTQQLAAQLKAQQALQQAQQQMPLQNGRYQQQANNIQQTSSDQDIFGPLELSSWWNPAPPQPVYVGY